MAHTNNSNLRNPRMAHSFEAQHAPISELVPELDRLAVDAMADWHVPGAAIAVVRDGKVALAKAYGLRNVEADLPVTISTQFLICSITKSFTATATALLHGEGQLGWTKPGREYIPEFRLHDAVATERVTVLDLLCHQSGLPRHDWLHLPGDRGPTQLLGAMRHLELSRDIRAAWQYNNLCYNVLGLLIERISGQSYEAFVRSRLTDKLGMQLSFTLQDLEASSVGTSLGLRFVKTATPMCQNRAAGSSVCPSRPNRRHARPIDHHDRFGMVDWHRVIRQGPSPLLANAC